MFYIQIKLSYDINITDLTLGQQDGNNDCILENILREMLKSGQIPLDNISHQIVPYYWQVKLWKIL